MKVVVRLFPQDNRWHLAHEKSYQCAFKPYFKTRAEAVKFAEENGCEVVKHSHDQLQNYI